MWPCYSVITVGTSRVTSQSEAFEPHRDVGPVYIKAKRLQLGAISHQESRRQNT